MTCVGLDLGTTKIAGVAIDTDPPPGRVLRSVSRAHGAGLPAAHPWEHLQDADRILAAARQVLRDLGESGGQAGSSRGAGGRPDGLCLTGQMHGVLYVDARGRAVSPLMTWLDNRGGQPHPAGGTWAEALSTAAGRIIPAGYGAATHFYNRHHGLVPTGAAWLCTLMDYLTLHLATGSGGAPLQPVTDPTIAASVGLADPLTGRPDPRALDAAGLGRVRPSETVGTVSRVGTTPEGTGVLAPLGDNQASFLGSVRDVAGMALLNVGTGGQVSAWLPEEAAPAGGWATGGLEAIGLEARPFPGGGVLLVGATLCAGQAYALLEGLFRTVCAAFTGQAPSGPLYERMNELAGGPAEAGPDGEPPPVVDTRFNGTRADPRITGRIEGLTPANLTPDALVRGFLRGIVGELHGHYAALERLRRTPVRGLVGSGNALRRNPALRAEAARRFGLAPLVPRLQEEAALGAALAAAVGLGACPGFHAAGRIIRYEGEQGGEHG